MLRCPICTDRPAEQGPRCLPRVIRPVSWFCSCPGIPMESIIVYQKVPHPGIQANLHSYYSQQVRAAPRETSSGAGTCASFPHPQQCDFISTSVKWDRTALLRFL